MTRSCVCGPSTQVPSALSKLIRMSHLAVSMPSEQQVTSSGKVVKSIWTIAVSLCFRLMEPFFWMVYESDGNRPFF